MVFRLLGPSWRQDMPQRPQEAPRGAQVSLQDRFWSQFGRFLVDLEVHFGSCSLLWCWFVAMLVCWSVGSLLCWFSGLLVVCLSAVWPQSPRPGGGWPAGQLDKIKKIGSSFSSKLAQSVRVLLQNELPGTRGICGTLMRKWWVQPS